MPESKPQYVLQERNISWMINSCNPTPLEFFRFIFPTHRGRAVEKYQRTLRIALERSKDQAVVVKLQRMKDLSMSIRHSVRQTNLSLHEEINTLATNQGMFRDVLNLSMGCSLHKNNPGDDVSEEDIAKVNEDGKSDEDAQENKIIDDEDAAYGDDGAGEVNARSERTFVGSAADSGCTTPPRQITPRYDDRERDVNVINFKETIVTAQ
ncbi:hypothetical protein BC936DRAFT_145544, partial [Jimgerdemannia flammicorona]